MNDSASKSGCKPGQSVAACVALMAGAPLPSGTLQPMQEEGRFTVYDVPNRPRIVCADSVVMLLPEDAGQIVVTGSHAALFRGKPDAAVGPDVRAIFFSDGGIGLDEAGVTRLASLDVRAIPAGAVSVASAPIGDARAIYRDGVLSRVNQTAAAHGIRPGQPLKAAIDRLLTP